MLFLAAVHSAPASNIRSPSGWMSTTSRPRAAMGERDAERDADLRAGAERAAGMAIGLIEIPQLERPVLQRAGGQHPVLGLDHVPYFVGEARQRDRRRIPVLRATASAHLANSASCARRDLRRARRCAAPSAGSLRRCASGTARSAPESRSAVSPSTRRRQSGMRVIVHRPFADADVAEADLDQFAMRRDRAARVVRLVRSIDVGRLFPIARVERRG